MFQTKTLLFITFLVFINLKSGYSILCWDCSSDTNPGCGDPFKNATFPYVNCDLVDPPPNLRNSSNVAKAVACKKVHMLDKGEPVIVRSCSFMKPKEHNLTTCTEESFVPEDVQVVSCHVCDSGTGCNPAPTISTNRFIQLILPTVLVYLFK